MPKRYYGYKRIRVANHPHSDHGWILEHRYVMEQHEGRYLTGMEVVHHINGDRKDNRIENLELLKFGDHSRIENKGGKRIFTESHRQNMSQGMKGRIPWNKGKKGVQISPRKGMHLSEETKRKLRGRVFSEEHRRRISQARRKYYESPEARQRASLSHKGLIPWNKGIKWRRRANRKNEITR